MTSVLYRHSEDMIKKLENAGLGFYVRDTDQKLGNTLFHCLFLVAFLSVYTHK